MLPLIATRWPFSLGSGRGHLEEYVTDHVIVALSPCWILDGDTESVALAREAQLVVAVHLG